MIDAVRKQLASVFWSLRACFDFSLPNNAERGPLLASRIWLVAAGFQLANYLLEWNLLGGHEKTVWSITFAAGIGWMLWYQSVRVEEADNQTESELRKTRPRFQSTPWTGLAIGSLMLLGLLFIDTLPRQLSGEVLLPRDWLLLFFGLLAVVIIVSRMVSRSRSNRS